jgi:hypothetical protein
LPALRVRWLPFSGSSVPATSGCGSVAPEPVVPRRNLTVASLERGQRRAMAEYAGRLWASVKMFDVSPWSCGIAHWLRTFA